MAGEDELKAHRDAIDALDREILARLSERARHAQAIGKLKDGSGAPAYRPEREAQVLAGIAGANPGPLSDDAVRLLFRQIMSACLALERPLTDRLPRTARHVHARRGRGPFRRVRRRRARGVDRRGVPRRRVRALRLRGRAGRELDRRRGRPHARPDGADRPRGRRRGEAPRPAEPDVATRPRSPR